MPSSARLAIGQSQRQPPFASSSSTGQPAVVGTFQIFAFLFQLDVTANFDKLCIRGSEMTFVSSILFRHVMTEPITHAYSHLITVSAR